MTTITGLGIVLFILMIIVGGKQGIQSFISLLFNFGFLFLSIVLIAFHLPPLIVTIGIGVIVLALTIFFSSSDDKTNHNAFLASLFVLCILIILIIPVEHWAQVQGFGLEDSDDLEGMSLLIGINYLSVAISAAILSTLGAIAEASIAITSGLSEIIRQHPRITPKRIFIDGITIGKQIIGTTLNTLFLSFFGGSLSLFMWALSLHYSIGNIINNKVFGAEFIVILFSLIGVIIAIPISALVMTKSLNKSQNKHKK